MVLWGSIQTDEPDDEYLNKLCLRAVAAPCFFFACYDLNTVHPRRDVHGRMDYDADMISFLIGCCYPVI